MERKIVFATHIGCGNRGCEALTVSIWDILELERNNTEIYCKEMEDVFVEKIGRIINCDKWNGYGVLKRNLLKIYYKLFKSEEQLQLVRNSVDSVDDKSIVLMTGGDLYCYENTIKTMEVMREAIINQGAKIALIGCSIEEKYMTDTIIEGIKKYDIITARESITYSNLKKRGVENLYLIPDSAFSLKPQESNVRIRDNTIGINISPFVGQGNKELFYKNIYNLIDYIMENTTYSIMFIPHVLWSEQDDRKVIKKIYKRIKKYNTERIEILEVENLNYCQIRDVISKCRFFIGARTHSVISAYSMMVPTLALGYSVKSIGIGIDVGMSKKTIINCSGLQSETQILNSFKYIEENEEIIREQLRMVMPEYIKRTYKLKNVMKNI